MLNTTVSEAEVAYSIGIEGYKIIDCNVLHKYVANFIYLLL